jgi:lipoate-protein ligase A
VSGAVRVEHWRGSATTFHARQVPDDLDGLVLWWCDVDRPALVLGSSQDDSVVDAVACARAGVEVVRRRSGGGAVLLVPGAVVWLDVLLSAADPRWHDDVGRAVWWLGEVWADTLRRFGVDEPQVHRAGMVATPWSSLVCFAGLGPGEVTSGDRKLVGISQRRTRRWARFQCALQLRDVTDELVALLAPTDLDCSELTGIGSVDLDPAAVRATFSEEVASRG